MLLRRSRLTRAASVLGALAFGAAACDLRPPHVLLAIEDPNGTACSADALVVAAERGASQRLVLSEPDCDGTSSRASKFPKTVTLVSDVERTEVDVFVEAYDALALVARGRTKVSFASGRTGTARVVLAKACVASAECRPQSECTGAEACVDGACAPGVALTGVHACAIASTSSDATVCIAGRCAVSTCGDAIVDVRLGEACDLGPENSDDQPEGCRTNCAWGACGDGVVDAGEVCDDGNRASGDGCSADCAKKEVCGDGLLDSGEACDDGINDNPHDACHACARVTWTATVAIGMGLGRGDPFATDLTTPHGLAIDPAGNLFVSVMQANRVFRIDADTHFVTVHAGLGTAGFSGDGGPATHAELDEPNGIAVDARGNCFIADSGNGRVRRVAKDGTISTVAQDFGRPDGLDIAADGALYVTDSERDFVYRVDWEAGTSTVVAGDGTRGHLGDGDEATTAQLHGPGDVAIASDGDLYVADTHNHRIRRVHGGVITAFAGDGSTGASRDGVPATGTSVAFPGGVRVDSAGNVYIAHSTRVRRVRTGGDGARILETVAGGARDSARLAESLAPGERVPARSVRLRPLRPIAIDRNGREVLVGDGHGIFRVRVADGLLEGTIERVAGVRLDELPTAFRANDVALREPHHLAFGPGRSLPHFSDRRTNRVYALEPGGLARTVLGTGAAAVPSYGALGTASAIGGPSGIAFDGAGDAFVVSHDQSFIARLDADSKTLEAFALRAEIDGASPRLAYGVARRPDGHVVLADAGNHRILEFDSNGGNGAVLLGTTSTAGCTPISGVASASLLRSPRDLAIDRDGNVLVADTGNHRVLRVAPGGSVTLAYGRNCAGSNRTLADNPSGLDVDATGNFYIASTGNDRILRVDALGRATIVAGTGERGLGGDRGPATLALLDRPFDVAIAPDQSLFITEFGNARVRRIDPNGIIETVAGQVTAPEMGPFSRAKLHAPSAMAWIEESSSYLVAGGASGRVFRVDTASDVVSVVVGEPGGYDDGKEPAVTASISRLLRDASGIAFDPRDRAAYIAERGHGAIRRLGMTDLDDPSTWTIATWLAEANGLALDAPAGLAFDPLNGILWISDAGNHVVRGVEVGGPDEILRIGHAGEPGMFGGDGQIADVYLDGPEALAVSPDGASLYIADTGNHRVLRVALHGGLVDTASVSVVLGGSGASGVDGVRARESAVRAPRGLALDAHGNLFVSSTNSVRVVNPSVTSRDGRALADGDGVVRTLYGVSDADRFPASVTNCLTGLHVVGSTVRALDACQGFMLELAPRSAVAE